MLFRRKHRPAPPPVRVSDPVVDAQIHWLANRGLVLRDGVSTEQWLDSAEDPTDPISLAEAEVDNFPCTRPEPMATIQGTELVQMVHDLADGLELPIDDVELVGDELKIRSSTTHFSYKAGDRNHLEVLKDIAEEFVDSAHVLIVNTNTFAIVHRDIADQARNALDVLSNSSRG